jgi:hypothetical protein
VFSEDRFRQGSRKYGAKMHHSAIWLIPSRTCSFSLPLADQDEAVSMVDPPDNEVGTSSPTIDEPAWRWWSTLFVGVVSLFGLPQKDLGDLSCKSGTPYWQYSY